VPGLHDRAKPIMDHPDLVFFNKRSADLLLTTPNMAPPPNGTCIPPTDYEGLPNFLSCLPDEKPITNLSTEQPLRTRWRCFRTWERSELGASSQVAGSHEYIVALRHPRPKRTLPPPRLESLLWKSQLHFQPQKKSSSCLCGIVNCFLRFPAERSPPPFGNAASSQPGSPPFIFLRLPLGRTGARSGSRRPHPFHLCWRF